MMTTLPLLKLFNSSNNYFDKSRAILSANRELVRKYLTDIKKYSAPQASIYLGAYDYFVNNPLHFDGATMTEDLPDIENLELAAMLHDHLYIVFNCAGNYRYRLYVDKLFRKQMKRMNKSSWPAGVRYVLLMIVLIPHTAYSYLFRKRKMTYSQKISVDGIITILSGNTPKKWYKEFKGEITWIVILTFVLFFVIY